MTNTKKPETKEKKLRSMRTRKRKSFWIIETLHDPHNFRKICFECDVRADEAIKKQPNELLYKFEVIDKKILRRTQRRV